MSAFYNEIDPFAAQTLRNLIAAGHIAPGVVDERSIEDITPNELRSYTQCHFFAGVGVWSLALRRAGIPDGYPVWTGSCPCQPFSAAGKGAGFADERHLWPAFHHLIEQCRPAAVLGEQVASKDADPWIDLVHTDMEALGYAFGAVPFPSAGVGAPHIRDRLYWVGHADPHDARLEGRGAVRQRADQCVVGAGGVVGGMADAQRGAAESRRLDLGAAARGIEDEARQRERLWVELGASGNACGLANTVPAGWTEGWPITGLRQAPGGGESCGMADSDQEQRGRWASGEGLQPDRAKSGWQQGHSIAQSDRTIDEGPSTTGPTNGLWRDADWLLCRDGKWRPVEPGTFPLAHGAPARVGRLRAYGNAINAEAARVFIEAAFGL